MGIKRGNRVRDIADNLNLFLFLCTWIILSHDTMMNYWAELDLYIHIAKELKVHRSGIDKVKDYKSVFLACVREKIYSDIFYFSDSIH